MINLYVIIVVIFFIISGYYGGVLLSIYFGVIGKIAGFVMGFSLAVLLEYSIRHLLNKRDQIKRREHRKANAVISNNDILQKIDDYIDGKLTDKQISDFALEIIKSKQWENLQQEIKETLHLLCDLHDKDIPNASWVPTMEEIKESRNKIKIWSKEINPAAKS